MPGAKPRPVLLLTVIQHTTGPLDLRVVYGTSQNVTQLYAGEFAITPADAEAFAATGLSVATKFNFSRTAVLPYDSTWFEPPPAGRATPQLGVLHRSVLKRAAAAHAAVAR